MRRLIAYERAQLWNHYAYAYFELDRYRDAIDAYEKVLDQHGLREGLEVDTLYMMAQLHFGLENYAAALDIIKIWFDRASKPGPNAYLLTAQAHYQLGRHDESVMT